MVKNSIGIREKAVRLRYWHPAYKNMNQILKYSLIVILCGVIFHYFFVEPKISKLPENIRIVSNPIDIIEYNADNLPNGPTKSSLFIVLAADKTNSQLELNELLQAYAKMKITELRTK